MSILFHEDVGTYIANNLPGYTIGTNINISYMPKTPLLNIGVYGAGGEPPNQYIATYKSNVRVVCRGSHEDIEQVLTNGQEIINMFLGENFGKKMHFSISPWYIYYAWPLLAESRIIQRDSVSIMAEVVIVFVYR